MDEEKERRYYYRPVPGSRDLLTSSLDDDEILREIETETSGPEPSEQVQYRGEWLGGVSVKEGAVVPWSVFDELAPLQTPLEQAVYFHLYRLSYGGGKNFCRVGKRELMFRARVSERRLNVALDGLVSKGHIKPLHRNTKGTLYRVFLPSEVAGKSLEPGVVAGPRREVKAEKEPLPREEERSAGEEAHEPAKPRRVSASGSKRKPVLAREAPLESPLNEERFAEVTGARLKGPTLAEMAEWFFAQKKKKPAPRERQQALGVLTGLLEDGFTREEVQTALQWFVKNRPQEKDLERLPYFMAQALSESEESNP